MDGSGYRPHREEPRDFDVAGDDQRSLLLLVVLMFMAAGVFFYLHRNDARLFASCLLGDGQSCDAGNAPPVSGRTRQPMDD